MVSGAANGIGYEVCACFSRMGYDCIGLDQDKERLRDLEHCKWKLHCDLMNGEHYGSIEEQILRYTERAEEITLVNNLGGSCAAQIYESQWNNVLHTFAFNLKSMVYLTEIAVKSMKKAGKGRIINVSSISGRYNLQTIHEDYAAAKSAILGYSRIMAGKLARDNILVNTVCPGIIGTDRIRQRWEIRDQQYNEEILAQIPLGHIGRPEEVAKAIAFLGGEDNTYITGAVLDINGGMYMP